MKSLFDRVVLSGYGVVRTCTQKKRTLWRTLSLAIITPLLLSVMGAAAEQPGHAAPDKAPLTHADPQGGQTLNLTIPASLKAEHEELHAELGKATKAGGKTGEAAAAVAKLLHPHFVKEEEYALPPLGLLRQVATGHVTPEMTRLLPLTDKTKAAFSQMLAEHQAIVAALQTLAAAARAEGHPEYVHFTEKLLLHAQTEEAVLYPATILLGEYLKLKLSY